MRINYCIQIFVFICYLGIISCRFLQLQARSIFERIYKNTEFESIDFSASRGWQENFCKRFNLVMRRVTTTGRELPSNCINTIKTFFTACQRRVNEDNNSARFINGDETTIYLDSPSKTTYEVKGARRVKATTCGAEKTRLSALFTVSADGNIYFI